MRENAPQDMPDDGPPELTAADLDAERERLCEELGREPTDEELSARLRAEGEA